jgi:titin
LLAGVAGADVLSVTTTADAGAGSLRDALTQATDGDSIAFSIPAEQLGPIQPLSALPPLAGGVEIDGTTQPGASCAVWPPTLLVQLDGSQLPAATPVLTVTGHQAVVRGLVVRSGPSHGIRLLDATDTVLQCNFVGTDTTGTQSFGNAGDGVSLGHASGVSLGSADPTHANVISGNLQSGIRIDGESGSVNVLGNYIGTNATDGALLGNGGAGVDLFNGDSNRIGTFAARNRIRGNGGGAVVVSGTAVDNPIRFNSISDNGAHGIDLVGALLEDANDPLDADEGPNRLQNWPEMASVGYQAGSNELIAVFSVPTAPANATYPLAVDFYVADALDEEGDVYVGTSTYSADDFAAGVVTRTFLAQGAVAAGDSIVATATDADGAGNTSEFSDEFAVVPEAGTVASWTAAIASIAGLAYARRPAN